MRKKVRRNSGRIYNKWYNPELGEYYQIYWDDWNDYRDGFRQHGEDSTLIARKSEANHLKIPELHTVRSYFSKELISYYNDRFKKINDRNNKIRKHLKVRKAKQYAEALRNGAFV